MAERSADIRESFPPVFVTGGSGFVGQRVLAELRARGATDVRVLTRTPAPSAPAMSLPGGWRVVRGSLDDTASWAHELAGVHTVLHLASSTGKVSAAQHQAVIVRGTESLVAAAERAQVARLLYVSSIAAAFEDQRAYPYAQAKRRAEAVVAASAMPSLIVRPTLVFGRASAVYDGLKKMARLPVPVTFGAAQVRVQPIDVDDLARLLVSAIGSSDPWPTAPVAMGGPDVVTLEALLRRMRTHDGAATTRFVHLPMEPLRTMLALVEPLLLPLLPLTAGQLATFVNHGDAGQPSAWLTARHASLSHPMIDLETMLKNAHGEAHGEAHG